MSHRITIARMTSSTARSLLFVLTSVGEFAAGAIVLTAFGPCIALLWLSKWLHESTTTVESNAASIAVQYADSTAHQESSIAI